MIGTIVNTSTILIGSFLGTALRKGIKDKYQNTLYNAMGLSAIAIGINAIVLNMSKSKYPVLFIISLAIGSVIGEKININEKFQSYVGRFSKTNLGEGLSTAILLFCIGTLSILGPIESAINNNHTYLFTNATLDFVTSIVLASTYGIGISVAAVVLFLWQGSIFLLATALQFSINPDLMTEISLIGGILIMASGISILKIKEIKSLNMLPALCIPILWFLFQHLFF